MNEVIALIGFALIVSLAVGRSIFMSGFRRGIEHANAIARDEHAADGFHVSEDTQP